ncbi:Hypothetical protein Y17_0355 [Pectobacterium wasabiae CFBP 3304]|nr:Hypothetical protein Y17_0355 [Pectobacterium wasabiae CFBP 3304]
MQENTSLVRERLDPKSKKARLSELFMYDFMVSKIK